MEEIDANGGKLPIKEFKLSEMVEDPAIVMVAKRGSGKSWICRAILKQMNHIPVGLIIAPTDKMSCFYGTFFPDSFIFYEFRSDILERLIYRQVQMIQKKKEYKLKKKNVNAKSIFIMDDCLASKGHWMKDETIQNLLFNGRHFKITYILTMQFPLGITPELRGNFDYIFLMNDIMHGNIKRMHEHYAGIFPTLDSFKQVFFKLTQNHGAMVIINRIDNGKENDNTPPIFKVVKYYRAPPLDNVKIGCSQFRKYHEKNYNPDWRDAKHQIDFNEFIMNKKKNKTSLNVSLETNSPKVKKYSNY